MLIAIVGTPSAGKRTVLEYLVQCHGFQRVGLASPSEIMDGAKLGSNELDEPIGGLSLSSDTTPLETPGLPVTATATSTTPTASHSQSDTLAFPSVAAMLDHVTRNWLSRHVTTDLRTYTEIEPFVKRPFFLLVAVDGPLGMRFEREREREQERERERAPVFDAPTPTTPSPSAPAPAGQPQPQRLTLESFVAQHDALLHGSPLPSGPSSIPMSTLARHPQTDFMRVQRLAGVSVCNNFPSVEALWAHLDLLDLMDEERLRPGWDLYFMGYVDVEYRTARPGPDLAAYTTLSYGSVRQILTEQTLASLASQRSNCMKRRVGALLVRSKRILATGYNGTPRGVVNCNQGGCRRCNGSARGGEALDECLCLHAEENALLEAGRDRIGDDGIIYCNTVKIVQCGVREVVYNQSYSMDAASAAVLKEGGVLLRQLHMPVAF